MKTIGLLAVAVLIIVGYLVLASSTDRQIDNQNTMLCESAKRSNNREYRTKCVQYYETNDIKYMRGQ